MSKPKEKPRPTAKKLTHGQYGNWYVSAGGKVYWRPKESKQTRHADK